MRKGPAGVRSGWFAATAPCGLSFSLSAGNDSSAPPKRPASTSRDGPCSLRSWPFPEASAREPPSNCQRAMTSSPVGLLALVGALPGGRSRSRGQRHGQGQGRSRATCRRHHDATPVRVGSRPVHYAPLRAGPQGARGVRQCIRAKRLPEEDRPPRPPCQTDTDGNGPKRTGTEKTRTGTDTPAPGSPPCRGHPRPPATGHRPRATGQRPRATGHRRTGHRPTATGHGPQATGHRLQATGYRLQATGYRLQATGHRPPATGHGPPATGHGPPATGHRPPATGAG